ncbi:MAG: LytR C-terminal domain-containing protein [bacterium]|nr:LytR C-terminal domain-containing protein [bacterium]
MRKVRKVRHKSPRGNQVFLGIVVLGLLLLLILTGKMLGLISSFGQPYAPDAPLRSPRISWEDGETLNLLVKAREVSLLSFNPKGKSTVVLIIPEEIQMHLPFGFGNWPVRSIYGLGQAESRPRGAELLSETVSQNFSLPVQGYLLLPQNVDLSFDEVLKKVKDEPLWGLGILRNSKTDLSPRELWNLFSHLREVRSDKVEVVDLAESKAVKESTLPDGSRSLTLNQVLLDQLIQSKIEDSKLKDESLTVGIFNTTTYQGLAEKVAREITNMGGRVVFTASSPDHLEVTVVKGKPSYTIDLLSKILAPHCEKKEKCPVSGSNLDLSRADINIILGEDYFLRYNTR